MKQYIGTQTIEAEEALRYETTEGGFYIKLTREEWKPEESDVVEKSISCETGYAIRYPDGREGFLRKDKFEAIYRPISGMNFGQAIEAAKKGAKITRRGWNGKGMWVVYRTGYPEGIPCNKNTADAVGIPEGSLFKVRPYLQMKCVDGSFQMWLASQSDILAEDWEIVE